jgi:hypothetical protein
MASVSYRVDLNGGNPRLRLLYTVTGRDGAKQDLDEPIPLQSTCQRNGGPRWWFTCPLAVNGRACGRRAAKLYLPPGGRYFGCRVCYDLTYESCQESYQFDRAFAQLARETGFDAGLVKRALTRR